MTFKWPAEAQRPVDDPIAVGPPCQAFFMAACSREARPGPVREYGCAVAECRSGHRPAVVSGLGRSNHLPPGSGRAYPSDPLIAGRPRPRTSSFRSR